MAPSLRQRSGRPCASVIAVTAAVALALAACGGSSGPSASADSREVAATVEAFDRAAMRHDFATICNRLLTVGARAAAGGAGCAAQLASGASSLVGTRLRLTSIVLRGSAATATIEAVKRGAPPGAETLQLVRSARTFRISSATGPPEN